MEEGKLPPPKKKQKNVVENGDILETSYIFDLICEKVSRSFGKVIKFMQLQLYMKNFNKSVEFRGLCPEAPSIARLYYIHYYLIVPREN